MQLPRGKFREIVRGAGLHPLLRELTQLRYTGFLTATWARETCTLVMQGGRYLFAECPPLQGDRAWERIRGLEEQQVDAIVTDLNDAELRLASEFNAPCRLSAPRVLAAPQERRAPAPERVTVKPLVREARTRGTPQAPAAATPAPRPAPAPGKPAARPPAAPPGIPEGKPPAKPAGEVPEKVAPAGTPREPPAGRDFQVPPDLQRIEEALKSQPTEEDAIVGLDSTTLASMEMAALDNMDVDHIATNIRKNARGIVKKLHLGHLMTEKDEQA